MSDAKQIKPGDRRHAAVAQMATDMSDVLFAACDRDPKAEARRLSAVATLLGAEAARAMARGASESDVGSVMTFGIREGMQAQFQAMVEAAAGLQGKAH